MMLADIFADRNGVFGPLETPFSGVLTHRLLFLSGFAPPVPLS